MLRQFVKDAQTHCSVSLLYVMDTMGKRIRQLRESRRMTQPELAKLLGVTRGLISQWEADQIANPKLKTIIALCELFKTDIGYLVYGPKRQAPEAPPPAAPFPTSDTGRFRLRRRGTDK